MKVKITILSVLLACCFSGFAQNDERIISLAPALYYSFENAENLAAPAVGESPLEFWQRGSNNTIGTPGAPAPALVDGPTADKKAVYVTPELNIKVPNPQVTEGGLLNYAIVVDFKIPEFQEWNALFQPKMENDENSFLYLNNGKIGKNSYIGNLEANTWYRLVLNVSGSDIYKAYIDGVLVNDMGGKDAQKVGLKDYFWLFTDNESIYDFAWNCAGIALFAKTLTETEILALSGETETEYTGTPFNGPHTVPCVIEAEDFDEGGEGVAYHDNSAGNSGGAYRPGESVDIEAIYEGRTTVVCGNLTSTEWMNYTIEVPTAGDYIFNFTWAGAGRFSVFIDNDTIATYTIVNTVSNAVFQDLDYLITGLQAGKHIIRIETLNSSGGQNFDKFEIKPHTAYPGTPFTDYPEAPEAQEIPGIVNAAYFDNGGEGIAYHVSNPVDGSTNTIRQSEQIAIKLDEWTGENYVTVNNGDWLKYSVNVTEAGDYVSIYSLYAPAGGTVNLYIADEQGLPVLVARTLIPVAAVAEELTWEYVSTGENNWPLGEQTMMLLFLSEGEIAFRDVYIDVIEGYQGTPHNGPHIVPCTVEAEDFDDGGEGIAYHDASAIMEGGTYRAPETVRIEVYTYAGVIDVGGIADGEWLKYTVEVPETGDYTFNFSFASWYDGTTINVLIDDEPVETCTIMRTSGYGDFQGSDYFTTNIQAGTRVVKVELSRRLNFDKFEIKKSTGIKEIGSINGSVYADNGTLYLKGFSSDVSLNIYNLVGQKLAGYEAVSGSVPVSLAKGVYVVSVQDKGKSVSYKVVVK
jgi:hypothetical protein